MSPRAPLVALLGACALGLLASGCGSSLGATRPITPDELGAAARKSASASAGRFSFAMEMSFPGAPDLFSLSGSGSFDAGSDRAALTMDLSSFASIIGQAFGALVGGQGGPSLGAAGDWRVEAISDGPVSYVRLPAIASELPAGKEWVRMDARTAQGADVDQLRPFTESDPRELLQVLERVSGTVETLGREELRGAPTTHYRAMLDPRALAELGSTGAEEADSLLGGLVGEAGASPVPLDVWVGDDGLVHRLTMSFAADEPETTDESKGELVFELYDVGAAIEIELPPASAVVDAAALAPES